MFFLFLMDGICFVGFRRSWSGHLGLEDERHVLRMENKQTWVPEGHHPFDQSWDAYIYVKEISFDLILTTLFWISVTQT